MFNKSYFKRILIVFFLMVSFVQSKTVKDYVEELRNMSEEKYTFIVIGYYIGVKYDLGLTIPAIMWKESSFGRYTINKKDGRYGSFGVAQILLETALRRNKNLKLTREELRIKLITDHRFNIEQARDELLYWKDYYKNKLGYKYWFTHMVSSYNAGWRGYSSRQGREYAEDIKKKIKALKIYFQTTKRFPKLTRKHMLDIQKDLRSKNIIE